MAFVVHAITRRFATRQGTAALVRKRSFSDALRQPPVKAMASSKYSDGELIREVLTVWYGSQKVERFDPLKEQIPVWFKSNKEFDNELRERFGDDVQLAQDGKWDSLIGNSRYPVTGELALVILLDQFARNIYRGSPKAYAGDAKSLQVANGVLTPDRWAEAKDTLSVVQRYSFLLPLMHQESTEAHDRCKDKSKELLRECEAAGDEGEECAKFIRHAMASGEEHRAIIAQFGRYPYRNECLGRPSTSEEKIFLEKGPRFGQ